MSTRIQLRRDSAAQWESVNPTLAAGEAGVELDTYKFKIGDGSTAWHDLPYAGGGGEADLTPYLKRDGTRSLTGNWLWDSGVIVNGVLKSLGSGVLRIMGSLYTGALIGMHTGWFVRKADDGVTDASVFESTDSANVPFFSMGNIESEEAEDPLWLRIGFWGHKKIVLDKATRDIIVDADALSGQVADAAHADEADHATAADTATEADHAAAADAATRADSAALADDAGLLDGLDSAYFLAAADVGKGHAQRLVVVEQSGQGDYLTIKSACDWVATQTRSSTAFWTIQVMPGVYPESPFTIPSYTAVLGTIGGSSWPTNGVSICDVEGMGVDSDNSSPLITMNSYAVLNGCYVQCTKSVNVTGSVHAIHAYGQRPELINCTVAMTNKSPNASACACYVQDYYSFGGTSLGLRDCVVSASVSGSGIVESCITTERYFYANRTRFIGNPPGYYYIKYILPGGSGTLTSCLWNNTASKPSIATVYVEGTPGGRVFYLSDTYLETCAYSVSAPTWTMLDYKRGYPTNIEEPVDSTQIATIFRSTADQLAPLIAMQGSNGRTKAGFNTQGYFGNGSQLLDTPDTQLRQTTAKTTISATAPLAPKVGDIWIQTK